MANRGYKLQEFVAHSGNVNCLRFGKKTRRQFLTGGDDQNVNLWSIGKPTSTTSLSGHTSPIESVAFDSAEVLVLAGASSGVIKLWDLEETKMVRTLTGHRSYCTACEFHPFGEFFASGSMDTNLKIWDIRKKGCIHTYKGHTRGISTIRFSPDGRWVVSGGFDNVVKVWDLTAGKLLHDFKFHEGHIRSIDFHPLEFLLATGSADRTVNFWDLETFELIGSTRREAAGVRSITFHPEGRTLFCGLDDSLKVYSWEPVNCHDSVEMGWSTLSDLCIHDGKLVGGAYYQNYVGVWVADISLIDPHGAGSTPDRQSNLEQKQEHAESRLERIGSNRSSNSNLCCTSPDIDSKEIKNIYVDSENPVTIKKVTSPSPKVVPPLNSKENKNQKLNSVVGLPAKINGLPVGKSFVVPSVVPRDIPEEKKLDTRRRESVSATSASSGIPQKPSHIKCPSSNNFDMEKISVALQSEIADNLLRTVDCKKESDINSRLMADNDSRERSEAKDSAGKHGGEKLEKTSLQAPLNSRENRNVGSEGRKELHPVRFVNGVAVVRGRTRSLVERFEKREGLNIDDVHKLDAVSHSKTEETDVSPLPPSCCNDEELETFSTKFEEEPPGPVTKNCSSFGFVSIFKTKFEHTQRGEMEDEEEKHIEMEEEDVEKASSDPSDDSFINDDDSDDPIMDDDDDDNQQSLPEEPLTDKEIEELIAELLEAESKAAEAQEALEEESVSKVEADVREELSQTLKGDELENAVADEMATFKEEWETVLDELETESAHLLEQLDGAGIELPSLYKWIESQAPHGCCTEAWKNRTQWVGSELTSDLTGAIADAEKYLQIHRPVRRKHGKVLEEGASGFLAKKLAGNDGSEAQGGSSGVDWGSFSKLCSDNSSSSMGTTSFGSKDWSSVYLASTPQQAAELGLKFPGVDEVEEIDDIEDSSGDPFVADAIANERELNLSEEQKRKFKKVKEEDDLKTDLKLRRCLKQRRHKNRQKLEEIQEDTTDVTTGYLSQDFGFDKKEYSTVDDGDAPKSNEVTSVIDATVSKHEIDAEAQGLKLLHNFEEMEPQSKKARIIIPDSDEEDLPGKMLSPTCSLSETEDQSNPQRDGDNVLPVSSLPVCNEKQNFRCTACDKVAIEVHAHPLLRVVLCLDCKTSMKTKMQDVDCSECYCRWCGRCSDLLSCKSCKRLFCSVCIRRNLGEEILSGIKTSGWQCCCCSPSILLPLVSVLEKIMESQGLVDSNTDTDSDNSDADINGHKSTKRRPKKKIRRILDDTELGEETKRKIAIEKERQERLKSLGAKFSSKTMFMDSGGCSKSSYETGSLEMLGDIQTGYIVNVVREEGEEAVRIPRSISAKLKSHQVAGIRFMWENIIQSIRKVKAGDKGLGCILAHTMGLGKTFQVISFLYAAMRSVDLGLRTALIVTPVSVLHNWRQEFIKWEPSEMKPLRVFMLEEVPRERRAELLQKWRVKGGVFLIGYTAFRNLTLGKNIKERHVAREICQALQDGPDILVCDEAHIIKNTRADVTQALKQVKCQRRIALTGSPLQNNLMEYYCMVDFVREGFLGSSHEFRNRFQNPIENGQHTNSTADDVKIMNQRSHILYEQLKGFVQRMDMNVVKMDLPPKTVYVMSVKLSPLQRKLYKRFLDVHGFTKDKVSGEKIMKRSFFAGYQALAQIWNHPGILQLTRENRISSRPEDPVEILLADDCSSDENTYYNVVSGVSAEKTNSNNEALKKNHNGFLHGDWWSDLLDNNCKEVDYSGKMVLLLDILTMSSNVGDKALVFSQSLSTLDLIEQYLSKLTRPGKKGKYWKRRKDWYRIDGRTESSERQKLVDCFNSPLNRRVKCVLISTRAGSLGINLYAANRVIIVDGSWNPTHDLQAIYRAWRYGQTKPVFAYRLLAHGTMEEKIYKRQVTKEGLAARVVDRQQVHRTISKEEMLHLFEFGDDESCDIPLELKQVREHAGEANTNVNVGSVQKQKLTFPNGSSSSDKLMQSLIDRHHPRWIANYHEHESLLQENEDEKLSKEEQEMAWEVYRRSIEWEERRVSPDEPVEQQHISTTESLSKQKPFVPRATVFPPADRNLVFAVGSSRCRLVHRKCTKLSHLLTLRSQGTKWGCSTVCGECAQEIKWEGVRSAK